MAATFDLSQVLELLPRRVLKNYEDARDWMACASVEEKLEWIDEDFPTVLARLDSELGRDSEQQMAILFDCILNGEAYTWEAIGKAYGMNGDGARKRFLRTVVKLFGCIGEFHARSKATLWRLSKTDLGYAVLLALIDSPTGGHTNVAVFLRGLSLRNKPGCYRRLAEAMNLSSEMEARRIMRQMCRAFRKKYVEVELGLRGMGE